MTARRDGGLSTWTDPPAPHIRSDVTRGVDVAKDKVRREPRKPKKAKVLAQAKAAPVRPVAAPPPPAK